MKVLHLVREAEDLTEVVRHVVDAVGQGHIQELICLAAREEDPDFDARLLQAVASSDRVICW